MPARPTLCTTSRFEVLLACLVVSVLWAPLARAQGDITYGVVEAAPAAQGDGAWTEAGSLPRLEAIVGLERQPLLLRHTHVQARLVGPAAHVVVTQQYENSFRVPISSEYVFPLPENSAVRGMEIAVGSEVIVGQIARREEARAIYEEAQREGNLAALLEQERPNIFTQSVANLPPGEVVETRIEYVQDLSYDRGSYEFAFPMVVGPRTIAGTPVDTGRRGSGWALDTDLVGDASRISPPVLPPGLRTGHDVSLELVADAGVPIKSFAVVTHEVAGEVRDDGRLELVLAERESIPNRDFVLRYQVAGETPEFALLSASGAGRGGDDEAHDGGFFTLVLYPPLMRENEANREFVFVVDRSGSMMGKPLAMVKDAMRESVRAMRPGDTFNVIAFAGSDELLWPAPRTANDANRAEADLFIDELRAGGGTELDDALAAAFQQTETSSEQERHRYVVFLTDGYVGNEEAILSRAQRYTERFTAQHQAQGLRTRVFAVGVGASPNTSLIDGLGRAGGGLSLSMSNREDPSVVVERLWHGVDRAVMTGISLDWSDADIFDVYPTRVPDLFATRPVVFHGRFGHGRFGRGRSGQVDATDLTVHGMLDGMPSAQRHHVVFGGGAADVTQGSLWARARVEALARELWDEESVEGHAQLVEDITRTALQHRIVTAYTSFVAVTEWRPGASSSTLSHPNALPEDVAPNALPGGRDLAPIGVIRVGAGIGRAGGDESMGGMGSGGGSGSGTGYGSGSASLGGKSASTPKLMACQTVVHGSLDKRIIQRVVRQHFPELRGCYERALMSASTLEGRIDVRFVIEPNGAVSVARAEDDTLGAPDVTQCVLQHVQSWQFPKAKGEGVVIVTYPFVFTPETLSVPAQSTPYAVAPSPRFDAVLAATMVENHAHALVEMATRASSSDKEVLAQVVGR